MSDDGVTINDGLLTIDDPHVEARLATLATRWGCSLEEALDRSLPHALADNSEPVAHP